MQDKFENNIKSRLANHEMSPPPMAWDNISKALKEEKPRVLPWKKWAGIAAAVLIPALLTVGYFWSANNALLNENQPVITHDSSDFNHETSPTNSAHDANINSDSASEHLNLQTEKEQNAIVYGSDDYLNSNSTESTGENRVVKFFKGIFADDESQNSNHNLANAGREKENISPGRKINVFTALTRPFRQHVGIEMSQPDLYAMYTPKQQKSMLQITAQNATEDLTDIKEKTQKSRKLSGFEFNPFGGVALLGSFNENSLIAPEFNQLNVESELATAYGAHASYKLNDRLKIRSGVGVIDIRQNTYEVPFNIQNEGSVHYNMKSYTNISPDLSSLQQHQNSVMAAEVSNIDLIKQNLHHQLQFVEIPVEMEYGLKNEGALQIAATGGLSTLIRNKNDVYAKNTSSLIARPTNIKSVSFSANAGVKMDYKISEKISVNVEPQLQYMINTVTANDDVQPYLLGVNAGISYAL